MKIEISTPSSKLLNEVKNLIEDVWPKEFDSFSERIKTIEKQFGLNAYIILVYNTVEEIIGIALITPSYISNSLLELTWVSVDSKSRFLGIGRKIIHTSIDIAHKNKKSIIWATGDPVFYQKSGCPAPIKISPTRFLFIVPYE